jgi:hypothetical protein
MDEEQSLNGKEEIANSNYPGGFVGAPVLVLKPDSAGKDSDPGIAGVASL